MKRLPADCKGSLSEAVMVPTILIERFLNFLNSVKDNLGISEQVLSLQFELEECVSEEAREEILSDIFELLNDIAPEGCTFATHIGDGCDYGFWEERNNDGR